MVCFQKYRTKVWTHLFIQWLLSELTSGEIHHTRSYMHTCAFLISWLLSSGSVVSESSRISINGHRMTQPLCQSDASGLECNQYSQWPVQPCLDTCTPATEPDICHARYPVTLCHTVGKLMIACFKSSHMLTFIHRSALCFAHNLQKLLLTAWSGLRSCVWAGR